MTTLIIYVAIAIAFLLLMLSLRRRPTPRYLDEVTEEKRYTPSVGNGRWLDLSERIFDPSDARWLEEELAFPRLAEALILDRKRLAIRWLEALRASFDEMVRTPEIAPGGDPEAKSADSWRMMWLVIRFNLLVSYASIVVKLFGPYHRLIPSFAWVPFSRESKRSIPRAALAGSQGH